MEDNCPIIQSVAAISFLIGILCYLLISHAIKKYIHEEYLKETKRSKLKEWLLDMPELLPTRALTKVGYILKCMSAISLLIIFASGVYIGHQSAEDKLCITTGYQINW